MVGALITPQLLFWVNAALVALNGVLLVQWLRWRRWGLAVTAGASLVAACLLMVLQWSIWGACLLPHPVTIAYRAGVTVCPGQAVRFEIKVILPPAAPLRQ